MYFPKQMMDARRWMVRPPGKQPISAHETRPIDYEPPEGQEDQNSDFWKWRWAVTSVLASFEQAKSYWNRHPNSIEGLTFVLHTFGIYGPRLRLICLDWDKCVRADGTIDSEVLSLIEILGSFTEFSRSGRGLHTFILVEDCPAFRNLIKRTVGDCKVDVLCSNPVAVTGNVFENYDTLTKVPFSFLEQLPFFEFRPTREKVDRPEWWSEDPLEDVKEEHKHLIPHMTRGAAVEGLGAYHQMLFASACTLARHGVTGRDAEPLLRLIPAEPEFSETEIRHAIECAYDRTTADGEFNNPMPEFGVIELPPEAKKPENRYGFKVSSFSDLMAKDLRLEYLVEGAFVGEGALFIGGREKTFKTGIAVDLLISLATGAPFLNHFPVKARRRSVLFTAEIGEARAKFLGKAVADGKGLDPMTINGIDIVDTVPSFQLHKGTSNPVYAKAILGLRNYLKDHSPEVVVFDPLYFAMGGTSVGDMYEIGTVLKHVTDICNEFKCWAVFCHHARKNTEKEHEPMDLSDFYGSGVGAFARQWILMSHAEPFRGGVARLYANIGGSSQGACGVWSVKIDEGQPDDIMERTWIVETMAWETGGSLTHQQIFDALAGSPTGMKPKELAGWLETPESCVKKLLKDLTQQGELEFINNKFRLPKNGDFDQ